MYVYSHVKRQNLKKLFKIKTDYRKYKSMCHYVGVDIDLTKTLMSISDYELQQI